MADVTVGDLVLNLVTSDAIDFTEEEIIDILTDAKVRLTIVKWQRPVFPVQGDWLVYNQDNSILQTFRPDRRDPVFQKMEELDSYKQYFWAYTKNQTIFTLANVPCEQERGW